MLTIVKLKFLADVSVQAVLAEIYRAILTLEPNSPDGLASASIAHMVLMKDVLSSLVENFEEIRLLKIVYQKAGTADVEVGFLFRFKSFISRDNSFVA